MIHYLRKRCIVPRKIWAPISYWTETGSNEVIKKIFSTAYNHSLLGKMLQLYQKPNEC